MTLRPNKHSNPQLSILHISAIIIDKLLPEEPILYDDLLAFVIAQTSPGAKSVLPYALSFLYSLQKIVYTKEYDCFRLVQ